VATPDNSNPLLRCVAPYHNPLLNPVLPPRLLVAGGALRRGLFGFALALVLASLEGTGGGVSYLEVSVRGGNTTCAASHAQALLVGVVALPVEMPLCAAVPADVAGMAHAGLAGVALCVSADASGGPHVFPSSLVVHQVRTEPVHYLGLAQTISHCVLVMEEAQFAGL
jgi:hypothetical protein